MSDLNLGTNQITGARFVLNQLHSQGISSKCYKLSFFISAKWNAPTFIPLYIVKKFAFNIFSYMIAKAWAIATPSLSSLGVEWGAPGENVCNWWWNDWNNAKFTSMNFSETHISRKYIHLMIADRVLSTGLPKFRIF